MGGLKGILRKNDFGKHSISIRSQSLSGYLILIYKITLYHFSFTEAKLSILFYNLFALFFI